MIFFQQHLDLHPKSVLTKLLTLDDMALCSRVSLMITDNEQYAQVLRLRGPTAQAILNLLQAVCWKLNVRRPPFTEYLTTALKLHDGPDTEVSLCQGAD
jgi:hypothetical protein